MDARMNARKRVTFKELERLARERAYTLRREGREIFWSRNMDGREHSSCGVADAWEDILLDSSSEKPLAEGKQGTTGEKP